MAATSNKNNKTKNDKNKRMNINNQEREESEIRILQINLNNCRLAHDLLTQVVEEQKIDIVIISELLYAHRSWIVDKTGKAVIWVTGVNGKTRNDEDLTEGNDFVGTKIEGIVFISNYISPNIKIERYIDRLEELISESKKHKKIFIAGDFNAR